MARAFLITEAAEAQNRRADNNRLRCIRYNLRTQARHQDLPDAELMSHYRLSKDIFEELCNELAPLLPATHRSTKIPIECKVLTALSFYATGSYQKPVGMSYLHGLSQTSVSRVINEVTTALNHENILRRYIKFPQTQKERRKVINGFSDKFGFPGILGCIDGTHVALVRPSDHEERFFNRKHYHSRNVQIIWDSELNILNVDATYGGASHDAYIWRNCEIYDHMRQLYQIGDSGYPLRQWLLTPLTNAEPESPEEFYTNAHCRVRNCVERTIGVLKARWRCLLGHRVLHYNHNMVAQIINACVVLHNICNRHRLPVPQMIPADIRMELGLQVPLQPDADDGEQLAIGRRQRDIIMQRLRRNR